MTDCKPVSTPMEYCIKLAKDSAPPFNNISSYRRLIGRLVYLTTTRPDISYAVGKLSQCLNYPTIAHYQASLRVLEYLKQSPESKLFFPTTSDLALSGYSDADWGHRAQTHDVPFQATVFT
ncbi:uncharacterized mitochondrial protein AtMg00810-like [Arachis hypogaea]|uniref:uncharacterized mitochondrial protein AtMg00810-like n=1 Tax=Arachis hypogaea TaxID=3818 RepID=UPI003B2134D3